MAHSAVLPCPHGDAVCSRARREPKRFLDSGLCMDCRLDLAPGIGHEPMLAIPRADVLVAHVAGVDVEVVA
jgi:hypothetical protein